MRHAVLALVIALAAMAAISPAHAHRLKVFATVEGDKVSGYAFFIGGGRAEGATLIIRNAAGDDLHRGTTDDHGAFTWQAARAQDLTIIIDARDGHIAEGRIKADRFVGTSGAGTVIPSAGASEGTAAPMPATATASGSLDQAALASLVDRAVDRAVSRQVRPLLEAYDEAEGRIRFNDVAGGIGMIVGLIGIGMWVAARRPRRQHPPPGEG